MPNKTLAATAAFTLLATAGHALAAQQTGSASAPKQPIPYDQLDAYMKASPKMRASTDWWAASSTASVGTPSDASARAPAMPPTANSDTAVNPATMSAPPSLPVTPPTLPADPAKANDPTPGAAPSISPSWTGPK